MADYSTERREHIVTQLRSRNILDRYGEHRQLMFVVCALVANEAGNASVSAVAAGMDDPSVVQAALELLKKAGNHDEPQP